MQWVLLQWLSVLCVSLVGADIYTSISEMHYLLDTEAEMLKTMDSYIVAQEQRLIELRRDQAELKDLHERAQRSPDEFLGHPINAFLLVKRLTRDWDTMQSSITEDATGQAVLANFTSSNNVLRWPSEEDLNGVATALMRLQDTYQLDTSQMAQGLINDLSPAYRQLSASDCFELGRQTYNSGDHHHTVLWMNEALDRLSQSSPISSSVERSDILEYLAFSNYMMGHVKHALKLTDELIEILPDHKRALGNKAYYEEALRTKSSGKRGEDSPLQDEALQKGYTVAEVDSSTETATWKKERASYERLCRGEVLVNPSMLAKFKCYYQNGPHPFLLLRPVKTEIAHFHPTIFIYHDVIYDNEIQVIKELASPKFQRATVQNYLTGALETANYRISKSSWLKEQDHPVVSNINQRIHQITGLEMSTAEDLQVANYGVGGHYEPHFDYARREEKDAFKSLGTGNRIATFLFYMSDVTGGGGTVFPLIETALWPQKGSAAFWYNLHPSGEGDSLTRHAACPVLLGEKWVSNKWIHERGQEFIRKCHLTADAL